MSERLVKANGIDVWTEAFGDPGDSPILLIMGAGAQGLLWPAGFCERLVAGKRYVMSQTGGRRWPASTCQCS